ncbi:ribosomal protein L16 [Artemisia annua]|uniref:Ribosomal protein L16 n=1 Tax=Artemisia annua TaxID=35608 RepID=A0A2U1NEB0_ARTAN|nr:ribosomal protein L16 [Artemisia annua]
MRKEVSPRRAAPYDVHDQSDPDVPVGTRGDIAHGFIKPHDFPDLNQAGTPKHTNFQMENSRLVIQHSPEYWVAVVKPGRILYEMGGVTENIAHSNNKECAKLLAGVETAAPAAVDVFPELSADLSEINSLMTFICNINKIENDVDIMTFICNINKIERDDADIDILFSGKAKCDILLNNLCESFNSKQM